METGIGIGHMIAGAELVAMKLSCRVICTDSYMINVHKRDIDA